MPRVVSIIILIGIVLLIGTMFFQVMVPFIVPLFLAAVMVVIFKPLHRRISQRCGRRPRLAALLTTLAIGLIVLLPVLGMLAKAIAEGAGLYATFRQDNSAITANEEQPTESGEEPEVVADEVHAEKEQQAGSLSLFMDRLLGDVNQQMEQWGLPVIPPEETTSFVVEKLNRAAAPLALGGVRMLGSMLIGLAIMVISMYYFFADGPSMIEALMRMSPLDDEYERELLEKFSNISRSVVVATLLSALAQGILAGIAFAVIGINNLFFLTGLTMLFAMIPFIGSAGVWGLTSLWLYFVDDRLMAAGLLALFGATVISSIDNVIKPLVLQGQSNLHPLFALLSVIGGVQVLGPIGILVGPMLVAFFQSLINMVNKELHSLGGETEQQIETALESAEAGTQAASTTKDTPSSEEAVQTENKQAKDAKQQP